MNKNIRIAKQLIRLAKSLVAVSEKDEEFEEFLKSLGFEISPRGEAKLTIDGITISYATNRDKKMVDEKTAQSPLITSEEGDDELYTGQSKLSSGIEVSSKIQDICKKVKQYEEQQ